MRHCAVCYNDLEPKQKSYCSVECRHKAKVERVGTVERICKKCGKTFSVLADSLKYHKHEFCSNACVGTHNSTRDRSEAYLTLTCAQCKKEFSRRQCDTKRSKTYFCGQECWELYEAAIVEVACTNCGAPLKRRKSDLAKRKNPFCSKECSGVWYTDDLKRRSYYTGDNPDWPVARANRWRADGRRCGVCRTRVTLREAHVHHLVKKEGYAHHREAHGMDNMITLCGTCHKRIHLRWDKLPILTSSDGLVAFYAEKFSYCGEAAWDLIPEVDVLGIR